jgi:hypothetical protein
LPRSAAPPSRHRRSLTIVAAGAAGSRRSDRAAARSIAAGSAGDGKGDRTAGFAHIPFLHTQKTSHREVISVSQVRSFEEPVACGRPCPHSGLP